MSNLKSIAKNIPGLLSVYHALCRLSFVEAIHKKYAVHQLKSKTTEEVFSDIFDNNTWAGKESVSGLGSDADQTQALVNELAIFFEKHTISSLLDIPCGDFYWMKNINLDAIDYIGADIVQALIEDNKTKYGRDGVRFEVMDLIESELPVVDVIFCRDCLVHLSNEKIFLALENICKSQAQYLLTTTFTDRKENQDIITGEWRTLNLECSPFMLPKPITIINEQCTESDGAYKDKSLGFWKVADIRDSLAVSRR